MGSASTLLALGTSLLLVTHLHGTPAWRRVERALGALLAVPHAAFAVGLALLLMPSGALMRLAAPLAGWDSPPAVATVQDPAGLALIAGLVLKEVPFLLWSALALLRRPDVAAALQRQTRLARSLGLPPRRLWWTVLWPQWAPRLRWQVLAVLAYGLTVVDVALIAGPGAPQTLAVLAWQALSDADPLRAAQGAAAAWLLAATLPLLAALLAALAALLRRWAAHLARSGPAACAGASASSGRMDLPRLLGHLGLGTYAAVVLALAFGAFAGPWPFPALWPEAWQTGHAGAWAAGGDTLSRTAFTAGLAAAVATACVALAAAWLAATPPRWDRASTAVLLSPLLLPPLLWVGGLYPLALRLRLEATVGGLAWAHGLMALPYALFALAGPWRSLDPRLLTVARLLGHGPWSVAWRVRLPLLRAPLAAAWAVAFAVSVAQFLPTQFIGAGRLPTVTTEAVTLAASGQRGPASAQALIQLLLPLAGFGLAAALSRRLPGPNAGTEAGR